MVQRQREEGREYLPLITIVNGTNVILMVLLNLVPNKCKYVTKSCSKDHLNLITVMIFCKSFSKWKER